MAAEVESITGNNIQTCIQNENMSTEHSNKTGRERKRERERKRAGERERKRLQAFSLNVPAAFPQSINQHTTHTKCPTCKTDAHNLVNMSVIREQGES